MSEHTHTSSGLSRLTSWFSTLFSLWFAPRAGSTSHSSTTLKRLVGRVRKRTPGDPTSLPSLTALEIPQYLVLAPQIALPPDPLLNLQPPNPDPRRERRRRRSVRSRVWHRRYRSPALSAPDQILLRHSIEWRRKCSSSPNFLRSVRSLLRLKPVRGRHSHCCRDLCRRRRCTRGLVRV